MVLTDVLIFFLKLHDYSWFILTISGGLEKFQRPTFKLRIAHVYMNSTRYYVAGGNVPFGATGAQVTDFVRFFFLLRTKRASPLRADYAVMQLWMSLAPLLLPPSSSPPLPPLSLSHVRTHTHTQTNKQTQRNNKNTCMRGFTFQSLWIKLWWSGLKQRVVTDVSEKPDVSTFSAEALKTAGTFLPEYTASHFVSKMRSFKALFSKLARLITDLLSCSCWNQRPVHLNPVHNSKRTLSNIRTVWVHPAVYWWDPMYQYNDRLTQLFTKYTYIWLWLQCFDPYPGHRQAYIMNLESVVNI
jgi:hypothetical protein